MPLIAEITSNITQKKTVKIILTSQHFYLTNKI